MSYAVNQGQLYGSGRRKYADSCKAEKLNDWRLVVNSLSGQTGTMIIEVLCRLPWKGSKRVCMHKPARVSTPSLIGDLIIVACVRT